jgi:protein-ribulosamine 3-kinase
MAFKAETFAYIEKLFKQGILNVMPVGGGSINQVYCLQTDSVKYLIKINDRHAFPGMFNAEAKGLETIKKTQTIGAPEVVLQGDFENESFLILEWIDNKRPTAKGSASLGEQLARMHQHTMNQFGAVTDNYMGSLTQTNRSHQSWSEFFVEERLKPMVQIAIHNKLISSSYVDKFNRLYERLPGLFEEEKPSLIHGDLWSGNYLISVDNKPYLIDPAIAYGHREFDIAMTILFGGFSNEFYEAYQYHFPLQKGWEQRTDLWNLYPLLVHLNLFGVNYLGQVSDCLQQYL